MRFKNAGSFWATRREKTGPGKEAAALHPKEQRSLILRPPGSFPGAEDCDYIKRTVPRLFNIAHFLKGSKVWFLMERLTCEWSDRRDRR